MAEGALEARPLCEIDARGFCKVDEILHLLYAEKVAVVCTVARSRGFPVLNLVVTIMIVAISVFCKIAFRQARLIRNISAAW